MSGANHASRTIDVRSMPPEQRHEYVFKVFDELEPGQVLTLVNDHEPVHLLRFMRHERRDFDPDSYTSYQKEPSVWVATFGKRASQQNTRSMGAVVFTSFEEEKAFDDGAFSPVPIYSTKDYKVMLVYFRAGQFIPVHAPGVDVVFLVHSGTGSIVGGSQSFSVEPGDIVIVPRGERRGVKAETDMELLHLVSPPPGDSDHEEVSKKLAAGQFE